MSDFRFDGIKSFDENCAAFLDELDDVDPEMSAILRSNFDGLVSIVIDGERDTRARSDFNAKIMEALDALVVPDPEKEQQA